MAPPDTYLEDETGEIYGQSEEASYLYIAREFSFSTKRIEENRRFRVKWLSLATYFLGAAVVGFAISIIGETWLKSMTHDAEILIKLIATGSVL